MEERLETASIRFAFVDEENMDRPSKKYSSHYTGYDTRLVESTQYIKYHRHCSTNPIQQPCISCFYDLSSASKCEQVFSPRTLYLKRYRNVHMRYFFPQVLGGNNVILIQM